ncbi:MAG: PilT/PilU family type 4a pilus ATPase [Verrucomicrobia bacterium]|nr:PilT/PilU family type 4a pilus ATPase [Verrucomicrobiota bacterium]
MNNDVLWLARLGLDQGLFTRPQIVNVRATLGDDADLMSVAQELIDAGSVTDVETLEKLAELALAKGEKGPPASDPFAESETQAPFAAPTAAAKSTPAGPRAPGGAPKFAFDTIPALDDAALAAGLRQLLKDTARYGASDLHLSTNARPFIRKNRALSYLSDYILPADDALRLNTILLIEAQKKNYLEKKDLDYALALSGSDRYRVNLMFHKNGAAGAYRMVPEEVRPLADLGFTKHFETIKKMLSYHNGLILVTGPVGSGKTTTLASMVAYLNETRTDHIITVEDPIEVVQPAKGCNVTQREAGTHTKSFFTALKGALREDPDIIVIGELRDLETIEMAISASETGHLVIGTMHTADASTTLNRLLDVFSPAQQAQIRASVAESLRGVVCQRLLPSTDGGVVLACEILVSNTAIQNLIREGKSAGLRNTMETGIKEGMCLMDNVVYGLWQEKKIPADVAKLNIANRVLKSKIS